VIRVKWFVIDVIVLLLIWSAVSAWVPGASYVLPPISVVSQTFVDLVSTGDLLQDIAASLSRTLGGFALACATALPLGLLLGSFPQMLRVFEPLIEVLRPISPIAWIPLSILWFGIGEVSKLFIIWQIAFFFILLNTISGVASTNKRLIEAARTLGASPLFLWTRVVFWSALPQILVGLRLGLAVSIGGVLLAEMIAANSGIGYLMERSRVVLNPSPVIVGMILIAFLGYLSNRLLLILENRLLRHRMSISFD
jgi:ABC-type nitrate/sulfonate/bicarbonate transport system permease component